MAHVAVVDSGDQDMDNAKSINLKAAAWIRTNLSH